MPELCLPRTTAKPWTRRDDARAENGSLPGNFEEKRLGRRSTHAGARGYAHPLDEPKFEAKEKQHYQKLGQLLKNRSTVEWLIRDELEAGVIAVAAGPQGSYKSTWVNHVAMRVAVSGKPVFILSPEGSGLQRRLQGWLDEFEPMIDPSTLPLYVRDLRVNLSIKEQMDALATWLDEIETAEGKPIALICQDTWSKTTGHDEDSNTETKLLLSELDTRIRRRKGGHRATILIAAHTGKSRERGVRGASAFTNDTEAEYAISFESGVVQVKRERFKDSPSLPPLMYKPTVTTLDYTDADGQPVTSVVLKQGGVRELKATAVTLKPAQKQILATVLALGEKATLDKIAEARGQRKNNTKNSLDILCDLGELQDLMARFTKC